MGFDNNLIVSSEFLLSILSTLVSIAIYFVTFVTSQNEGDNCGTPPEDCPALKCASYQCTNDPNICYGCCQTCTWEYNSTNVLECSGIIPQNRVCPTEESCNQDGSKCFDLLSNSCSYLAPCAPREYCQTTDPNVDFYISCAAYPDAQCQMTGCGGCTEYFTDTIGNIVDCDADICTLPSVVGNCDAALPRYFYNSETGICEQFIYGGCGGNGNNFQTIEECESNCSSVCEQTKIIGTCKASLPRYYFNYTVGECQSFNYGGCDGNLNNFETLESCQASCNLCELGVFPGPCKASINRYYYNVETSQCELFTYGGCQANANNFETLAECNTQCVETPTCQQEKKIGPCRALIPRYFFNSETGECQSFDWGGCQENDNNFETLETCQSECNLCDLPAESGNCLAAFNKYFFNSETDECEPFIYGGCGGNANNFETLETCNDACATSYDCTDDAKICPDGSTVSRDCTTCDAEGCDWELCPGEMCELPMDVGPCEAIMPMYYFNSEVGECQSFDYGGCAGNDNRFETMDACENQCHLCGLAARAGPCKAAMTRYYYNAEIGGCEEFTYGGCEANANNFEILSVCEEACDEYQIPNGVGTYAIFASITISIMILYG